MVWQKNVAGIDPVLEKAGYSSIATDHQYRPQRKIGVGSGFLK